MNTFDFLRKLYKSSTSVVIVCNATKISFWSNNLPKLALTDDDITADAGAELFGKPIYQLPVGEFILHIGRRAYTYSVKSICDRVSTFVVVEIRVESINSSFVNSDEIADIFINNDTIIKENSKNILSVVEDNMDSKAISDDDYKKIESSIQKMTNSTRALASVIESKKDFKNTKQGRNSISTFATEFINAYIPLFNSKNIKLNLNCIEDVYARIGKVSFNNLCASMLNRVLCISDGYIDEITLSVDMLGNNTLDLCVFTNSTTNILRVTDMDELKEKLKKQDAIGTDLFAIKYFCENHDAEATQKVNFSTHNAIISVRIPECESDGALLFKCENDSTKIDKFSNEYLGISEYLSHIE